MRRRSVLAAPLLLAGCSVLPDRAYLQRRDWPLEVARPAEAPGGGRSRWSLLVRAIAAGPGLEERGLRSLLPDGSVRGDYYEQWVVPPAQAVEAELRAWLVASGRFAAVLAPGSRAPPDFVLEGELTALDTGPQGARAVLSYSVLDERGVSVRVLRQGVVRGTAKLSGADPAALVAGMEAALGVAFAGVEAVLAWLDAGG